MIEGRVTVAGLPMPVYGVNTLIIGSGAAALAAAVWLGDFGQHDLAIVTESWGGGTSAHAGSDKQTYYKLALDGRVPDSARLLAEDLFAGGSMHGDIALCEARHSAQAFFRLVQLGVPFPHDRFGGYPGYRTDHDDRGRATSAGPRTSQQMVEALSRELVARRVPLFEPWQVVSLLTADDGAGARVIGALALDLAAAARGEQRFALFNAVNVVLGTGGPGGMYSDAVYPAEQTGSIGVALRAGAVAQNLTESQFGLASIAVRWNVSGSYQQVVPRYVSTDAGGGDAREFLNDEFPDLGTLTAAIFRKGYQWPFDPRRVRDHGSSFIDLLVHRERIERGRRVFLDFTRNPDGGARLGPFSPAILHDEPRQYLEKCGATAGTPVERLAQMNQPALDFYRSNGIDLRRDRLEIAVCAQHNNGGLTGNLWWESSLAGLFPVGEVNGSHGVRRPGGASLNAGQVGALRAAMYIANRRRTPAPAAEAFSRMAGAQAASVLGLAAALQTAPAGRRRDVHDVRHEIQRRMSSAGAHVRRLAHARQAAADAWRMCREFDAQSRADGPGDLPAVFRNRDLCLAHAVYLTAITEYLERGGRSRGSFLVMDDAGEWTLNPPGAFVDTHVLEVSVGRGLAPRTVWADIRPLPVDDGWFETVWKAYRDGTVFD
jgi:succinate dehydrogenase/fumarate reductase flavoprotein subunit